MPLSYIHICIQKYLVCDVAFFALVTLFFFVNSLFISILSSASGGTLQFAAKDSPRTTAEGRGRETVPRQREAFNGPSPRLGFAARPPSALRGCDDLAHAAASEQLYRE